MPICMMLLCIFLCVHEIKYIITIIKLQQFKACPFDNLVAKIVFSIKYNNKSWCKCSSLFHVYKKGIKLSLK